MIKWCQNWLLDLATNYIKVFTYMSYILNFIGAIVIILWLFKDIIHIEEINPVIGTLRKLDLEALFTIITSLALIFNQLNRKLYERTEYSPADVLALGYVNNFLLPVITQLKEDGVKNPIIGIYKPTKINELEANNIDLIKAELRNKKYVLQEVNLNLKQARARDILTIQKNKTNQIYFDFPNTLLSLINYIDYKSESKANSSSEKLKAELGEKLITQFYNKIAELTKAKRINIKFCDSELDLF